MSRLLLDALSTRRYPLCAVGYKRTREHLLAWKPVLPSVVKGAEVYLSRLEQEAPLSPHSGSWLFLYENIPQLKYHNPAVKFSFEAHHQDDSKLVFTLGCGETKVLVTTGLRQKQIRTKVEKLMEEIL